MTAAAVLRAKLIARLRRFVVHGGVVLSSGKASDVYVDVKAAALDPVGLDLISTAVLGAALERGVEQIGGPGLGAAPIIGAAVCRSLRRRPLNGFIVRGERGHGLGKRIEGRLDPRAATMLVDDVATSGGSLLSALAALREAGGEAGAALVIVDRQAGAGEALAEAGCELAALTILRELLP